MAVAGRKASGSVLRLASSGMARAAKLPAPCRASYSSCADAGVVEAEVGEVRRRMAGDAVAAPTVEEDAQTLELVRAEDELLLVQPEGAVRIGDRFGIAVLAHEERRSRFT